MRPSFIRILLLSFVFSCQSSDRHPPGDALTIMVNAAPGGVNSQIAEWLEEELPGLSAEVGVPLKFLPAGLNDADYKARIALDIKAGRGADIIAVDQFWIPEFAAAGFLLPLDHFLEKWPDWKQYYPSVQKMGSFRGDDYLLVWDADVRLIFYHRRLLERAGIELPWQPSSWEDIITAAHKIKAASPEVIPLQINAGTVMDEATTMQGFFMLLLGAAGQLYDLKRECWITHGEPLRRTLRFYRRIYQEEKLADPALQIAPKAREKTFTLFSQGKIAVYVESTWFYSSVLDPRNPSWGIKERDALIGWAKMPGGGQPGDPPFVSISGGNGLIINPHSRQPELVWQLAAGLNQLDRQKRLFLKKPFTPTRKDLAALPEVQAHPFIAATANEILPFTTFRPALREYPEISFHVQFLTERVVTGQLDVDPALAEFAASVENIVGKEKICSP